MRFTETFNDYMRSLTPEQRDKELRDRGYSRNFSQYKPKSSYNADTATQSPSYSTDLAINNAYSQPLQTEAATGDAYPRIDYGSNNPFSQAANMGQYMADQAAIQVQNTTDPKPPPYTGPASERAHIPKYMRKARETFGMTRNEVLGTLDKAGIKNLDSDRDITTLQGYFNSAGDDQKPSQTRKNAASRARQYNNRFGN